MSSIGVYRPGGSLLHRLPAGAKLALLVVAALCTLFLDRPWQIGVAVLAVLALYAVALVPVRVILAQIRPLLWLLVLLAAFQVLFTDWQTAVVVVGTLLALVLLAGLVSLTTRTAALVDAVVWLSGPLRHVGVDPERVGLMLSLGIRSVPVVVALATEVRDAQLARGLSSSPTAFAVPLVVRSLRHADRLGEALVARGVDD